MNALQALTNHLVNIIRRFLELESSLRPFRSIVYITYSQIDEYVLCGIGTGSPLHRTSFISVYRLQERKSAATETLIETPLKKNCQPVDPEVLLHAFFANL